MWVKLSHWLHKISAGWLTLAGLAIFLLFTALVLPGQSAQAEEASQGADTPDLSFYYSIDDLYDMAETYGEEGRQAYIKARFTFDLLWPIVYALFLATSLSWLFRRGFSPGSGWRMAHLAPILGMIFDYLENISTSLVMLRYPARTPVVDFLAPLFTAIKWVFVGGSFVLLVIGMAAWVISLFAKRREV